MIDKGLQKDDMENTLDESHMSDTKAEMADGQFTLTENTDVENHGNLRKRGFEADEIKTREVKRRKSVNSNSETKERKKAKKLRKVRGKGKRKSSKKYLEKEILELKLEIAKLKAQSEKKIKRAKNRKRVIKGQGKEIRDTECSEKWATFTSVSLGPAPIVIKQVDKYLYIFTTQ